MFECEAGKSEGGLLRGTRGRVVVVVVVERCGNNVRGNNSVDCEPAGRTPLVGSSMPRPRRGMEVFQFGETPGRPQLV